VDTYDFDLKDNDVAPNHENYQYHLKVTWHVKNRTIHTVRFKNEETQMCILLLPNAKRNRSIPVILIHTKKRRKKKHFIGVITNHSTKLH